MERQHSRRRRPPRTQEPQEPPGKIHTPQPRYSSGPSWAFVVLLILFVVYLLRPDIYLQNWIGHSHGLAEERLIRPRIELHPEDHVYRPPVTHHLDWRVTTGNRNPDGVLKQVFLINGEALAHKITRLSSGRPTVEARSGDTLIITVTNALHEQPIALHWHGLHVANAVDGAAAVSQCPIPPGTRYVYNVSIPEDQSGTFWYHAHSGLSRQDGLFGGLVVHAPVSKSTVRGLMERGRNDAYRYGYDKELLLLIGDWYHLPAEDVLAWYQDPGNFGNEPVPDSLLINGVGHFNCDMAVPARPVDCEPHETITSFLDLDPHASYRIRVVNTGALGGFTLVFDQESLELLQVDSVDVERPMDEDINTAGILYPGQRMDFVLRPPTGKETSMSSMTVKLDQGCFKYMNHALTPDQTFPIHYQNTSTATDESVSSIRNSINLEEIPSSASVLAKLADKADETHVVYTKIQKMARLRNMPFGFFNMTIWKPQSDPQVPLIALPREKWDSNQFSITTGPGPAWVDLVVNNLDEGPHPFHMHGHHFYILATHESTFGWGSYNPFEDDIPTGFDPQTDPAKPYDLSRASLRDTVQIPSRGYAVLRFKADNPGVWLFHCHILWHFATGMAMLIDVQGDPAGQLAHDTSAFVTGEQHCSLSSSKF
ncbi:multicopper oxidase-domain-containing protein [Penicillium hetheringtonii]|uniref:Multicopper oxidase-domain-containing protein n=1 Tax=Penicillium hetheringtonii TaxID=911720 RepID=A0AAD6DXK9_9EURO|nr:multicopper oxidase-domain-containing protein [Penicillium hetheringtonii]